MSTHALPAGYVSFRAAARLLGVTEMTVRRWADQGRVQVKLVTVQVPALTVSEVERMRSRDSRPGGPSAPEPRAEEDFAAWQEWNKRTKKYTF